MIITLEPGADQHTIDAVVALASSHKGVTPRQYTFQGENENITEIHLIGDTRTIPGEPFEALPGVRGVVRVATKYRIIGRPPGCKETYGFEYNGVPFNDRTVSLFAGLCAVDTRKHVEEMLRALAECGIATTRMGAYKPRTSPYDFQGLGSACLPWVFELAGKYGIKVIAMEVCNNRQLEEVRDALERAGRPTGVMLQIGTRNAQNFELLKDVGQQREFPVLYKRGMGLTLEESLNACEYIASEGNPNIVFCLRGVKSHLSAPHRNLVDFCHVPVVRRQTRLPVCIDPSHGVGPTRLGPDGIPDIFHAVSQGIITGATMALVEFHPHPKLATCDGPQALTLDQLPLMVKLIRTVRATYDTLRAVQAHQADDLRALSAQALT